MNLCTIENKSREGDFFFISSCKTFGNCNYYQTSFHRHLIITDSLLCFSLGKKRLRFSKFNPLRASLHGGGGPQVGEVTRLGGVTRLFI